MNCSLILAFITTSYINVTTDMAEDQSMKVYKPFLDVFSAVCSEYDEVDDSLIRVEMNDFITDYSITCQRFLAHVKTLTPEQSDILRQALAHISKDHHPLNKAIKTLEKITLELG